MLFNTLKTISFLILFAYATPFLIEGIKKEYKPLLKPQNSVGIVHLVGFIDNSSRLIDQLHFFFKNPLIKGIIIKIDCAEITAGTSQTIFYDIKILKKMYPKPIVALVENKCLAGAYLVASICDHIIATESSIVGNIKQEINFSYMKTKKEGDCNLSSIELELHQQLVKHIALARRLPLVTAHDWANENIFTGTRALTLGLVDEIGSLCTATRIVEEKALTEGEIEWVEYKNGSLFRYFPEQ